MSKRAKQKMFNTVWKGVHDQGGPSLDREAGGCVYHAPDGRKCAAGLLFTDEEHGLIAEWHEETATFERLVKANIVTRPVLLKNAEFVNALQHIHDRAALEEDDFSFFPRFESEMRTLAHDHGLEVPE